MRSTLATLPGSAKPNEDYAVATDDLVVVLDGATTPGALDTGCRHGTRWFSRALGAEIIYQLVNDSGMALADGLASAIKSLAERHALTCDIGHPGHPSATVAMIRESEEEFEYLVLADATVAINTHHGVHAFTDTRLDHMATAQHDALMAAAQGTREHDAAFADLTTALRSHRNRHGGFWVAAVDPQAAYEAISGSVPRIEVMSAAAMSDGASILADRFQTMSWPETFELMASDGPAALLREVRRVEISDAEGTRWPRGKVHDDATVILCEADDRTSMG